MNPIEISMLVEFLVLIALALGSLLMAIGGITFTFWVAEKVATRFITSFDFNREFIAFVWDRTRKRIARKTNH